MVVHAWHLRLTSSSLSPNAFKLFRERQTLPGSLQAPVQAIVYGPVSEWSVWTFLQRAAVSTGLYYTQIYFRDSIANLVGDLLPATITNNTHAGSPKKVPKEYKTPPPTSV